jgi:superfamily II DNA or RNA helicase
MPETFLTKFSHSNFTQASPLTPLQTQMDSLVSTFAERAMDTYSLTGIVLGGAVNRGVRWGTLAASRPLTRLAPSLFTPLANVAGWSAGLIAESVIFDAFPKFLKIAIGREDISQLNLHGELGLKQGSIHSIVSLLGIKLAGIATAYQNSILQNFAQASSMVATHHMAALLNLSDKPKENVALQLIEAEVMVLHLWMGMRVLHQLTPSLIQWEQAKDLKIQIPPTPLFQREDLFSSSSSPLWKRGVRGDLAVATGKTVHAIPDFREPFFAKLNNLKFDGEALSSNPKGSPKKIPFNPFPARDYQEWAMQAFFKIVLEWRDRGLIVLPTGTGKTITFADLVGIFVAEFPNSLRTLVISHREEILDQNAKKIGKVVGEENVGIVQGEREDWNKPVVMASIQTLIQKDPALLNRFDFIVLDEAHHYVHGNEWFAPLVKLGFFTPEGEIVYNPNRLLVGFTATPDRFTGKPLNTTFGVDGLIFERDITWMIDRSHLLTPFGIEVNLEVPGAKHPAEALKMASPEEKARVIGEVFYDRLHHGDKFKRTMVFVSPRTDQNSPSEVGIVTEYLNQIGIKAAGITDETVWKIENGQVIRINGGQAAKARKEVIAAYKRGEYDALVNVNIATEGFDDEGTEAVVIARALESRGMFVQIIGRALRPDRDHPERLSAGIVDLGGNLRRHRLNIDIKEIYRASQGKLKREETPGPTGPTGPTRPRPQGQQTIEDFEINELGQIVPGSKRSAFSLALEELLPTPEEVHGLAYRMGIHGDTLFRYYNNNELPMSYEEVERIATKAHDPQGKLLDAWATDQAEIFAREHRTDHLSEGEKEILNLARFGFFRYWRGIISEARDLGTKSDTLRAYLEEGKMSSSEHKQNFYRVLVRLMARAGEEEKGWQILRRHLEGAIFGESWRPTKIDEFKTVGGDQLEGLFQILRDKEGAKPEVILLQFQLKKEGALEGFTAVRPGEEKSNPRYGKIQVRSLGNGVFEVEKGWGKGADEVIKKLKESVVFIKEGRLTIRSRGWLRLGTEGRGDFHLNDLPEMRGSDLEEFRRGLRDPDGAEPEVMLLQFQLTKEGALTGFTAVRPGEEKSHPNYGKIQVRYLGENRFKVTKAWHNGRRPFLEALRKSSITQGENPVLRIEAEE